MSKTYPIVAVLCAILFTGCAHRPQIANFGFYSYDPQRERLVACLESEAMAGMECESLVRAAILHINATLGYKHYKYAGILSQDEAQSQYDQGVWIVSGAAKLVGRKELGVTMPRVNADHLLEHVMIALNPELMGKYKDYAVAVVIHELTHALGVMHAECDGPFKSNMTPAVSCPAASPQLTVGDGETLRAAYPKK